MTEKTRTNERVSLQSGLCQEGRLDCHDDSARRNDRMVARDDNCRRRRRQTRRSHDYRGVPLHQPAETPIAITAVNAEMLEQRSQTSIYELTAQAPNVQLAPQGQANGSGIIAFIRGVGQTDFNFALEPGVGIYIDDVYYPTSTGSLVDLLDLERVEVLRGPQGTWPAATRSAAPSSSSRRSSRGDGTGSLGHHR